MSDIKEKTHHDPRMGDEDVDDEIPQPSPQRSRRHAHFDRHPTFEEGEPRRYPPSPSTSDETVQEKRHDDHDKPPRLTPGQWILKKSPIDLNWIPNNWSWSKIKPVIRCALTAWVSVLFFVIPKLEVMLGQVCLYCLLPWHHPVRMLSFPDYRIGIRSQCSPSVLLNSADADSVGQLPHFSRCVAQLLSHISALMWDESTVGFLQPPSAPFIAVLEQEIILLLCVTAGWAFVV